MKLKGTPDSICDITEENFWAALKVPSGEVGEALRQVVALGQQGKKKKAYEAFAGWLRSSLHGEWQAQREELVPNLGKKKACVHNVRRNQSPQDLLKNKINVWHDTVVDFGPEIDWDYNNTDKYGFHYLFWLQPGIQRLIEHGEGEYRTHLTGIVTSYYRARNDLSHPKKNLHLVYYELGSWAKLKQLLPLYLELINTGSLSTDAHEAFLKLFLGFARSLYRLQRGYRGGNWQVVGCSGLLTLSLLFPFKEAGRWRQRALQYLSEHLRKDFFADGCHSERCWGYGHMSLSGLTHAWKVAERHGGLGKDGASFMRMIRKGYRWFARTLGPKERKPAYGDCHLSDGSGILTEALRYFPKGMPRDLGVDRSVSYYLTHSGFAIMRNGGGDTDSYVNMSLGPWAGWHSHMDLFNLNLWSQGTVLLEEVGRFGGYGEALTILFRAPESHNQVTVDGMHYDILDAKNRAARDVVWHSTPEADFLSAWHTAYRWQPLEPQSVQVAMRRTVVFVKDPGYTLVFDGAWEESGSGKEGPYFSLTQNWHSPFPFRQLSPTSARTKGTEAVLLSFAREDFLRRLECGVDFAGSEATGPGEFPERYYLRARRWMDVEYRGATGFASVLMPFTGEAPAVSIQPLELAGARLYREDAFEIVTPRGKDVIVLNPEKRDGLSFRGKPIAARALISLGNGRGTVEVKE